MSQAIIPYPSRPGDFSPPPCRRCSCQNARTAERFFEFFTANIRNKNTRRAYYKAACRFAEWGEVKGLRDPGQVRPLLVGHVMESNPAHSVRAPKNAVRPCSIATRLARCFAGIDAGAP